MKIKRFAIILLILILITFLFVILYPKLLIHTLASNLVTEDPIKKADAIVVLGGGDPSRLLEAIELHNEGLSGKIIITRGGEPDGLDYLISKGISYPEEPELSRFIAKSLNLDENTLILLPGRVYGTKDEAESVRDYSEENGLGTLIVTTSAYHTKRAKIIFNDVFEGSNIFVMIKPSRFESYDAEGLSTNKSYWKYVIFEYQKLLYYYADEII